MLYEDVHDDDALHDLMDSELLMRYCAVDPILQKHDLTFSRVYSHKLLIQEFNSYSNMDSGKIDIKKEMMKR